MCGTWYYEVLDNRSVTYELASSLANIATVTSSLLGLTSHDELVPAKRFPLLLKTLCWNVIDESEGLDYVSPIDLCLNPGVHKPKLIISVQPFHAEVQLMPTKPSSEKIESFHKACTRAYHELDETDDEQQLILLATVIGRSVHETSPISWFASQPSMLRFLSSLVISNNLSSCSNVALWIIRNMPEQSKFSLYLIRSLPISWEDLDLFKDILGELSVDSNSSAIICYILSIAKAAIHSSRSHIRTQGQSLLWALILKAFKRLKTSKPLSAEEIITISKIYEEASTIMSHDSQKLAILRRIGRILESAHKDGSPKK